MKTLNGADWRMPVRGGRRSLNCTVRPEVRDRIMELATEKGMSLAGYLAWLIGEHVGMDT